MPKLLVFGAGYTGLAIAHRAQAAGLHSFITSRGLVAVPDGVTRVPFDAAQSHVLDADYLVSTAPPDALGDPVIARYAAFIIRSPARWIGYLSTTGVYGDRGGGWVDETTPPAPGAERSHRRLAAEQEWASAAGGRSLDLIRLAGIYGPGRSALDDVRGSAARRVVKPGHLFGRIHRDDIAKGVLAAMRHKASGTRVLNFSDDEPAESAAVVAEAARLLGREPPPEVPFETAWANMSDMGRSFWAENRKVANTLTKSALQLTWQYPTYREGLEAILASEGAVQVGHGILE